MNLKLKIIGIGNCIGLGSTIMWLMIFVKAHLDNNYIIRMGLNNFNEAGLETVVLIVGMIILIYDIFFRKESKND